MEQYNLEPVMEGAFAFLEPDVKKEYLQAMEEVPHLVETETPKAKFLRVEGNDPWKAARRLAMYWKFRKQVRQHSDYADSKDEGRWLRPMRASGGGFLTEREVHILKQGIYSYHYSPEEGPIFVVNGACNKGATPEMCQCLMFYLVTIVQDEALQTEGVTIVFVVTSEDTESFIDAAGAAHAALGFPAKVKRFAVVQNYEMGKENLLDFLAFRLRKQVTHNYGGANCDLICSSQSRQDLLSNVNKSGIPWHVLPRSCGGRVDDNMPCQFLRQRIDLEGVMAGSPTLAIEPPTPARAAAAAATNTNHEQRMAQCPRKQHKRQQQQRRQQRRQRQRITCEPERLRCSYRTINDDNRRLEEQLLQARRTAIDDRFRDIMTKCNTMVSSSSSSSSTTTNTTTTTRSTIQPANTLNHYHGAASLLGMEPGQQQQQEQLEPFFFPCPDEPSPFNIDDDLDLSTLLNDL